MSGYITISSPLIADTPSVADSVDEKNHSVSAVATTTRRLKPEEISAKLAPKRKIRIPDPDGDGDPGSEAADIEPGLLGNAYLTVCQSGYNSNPLEIQSLDSNLVAHLVYIGELPSYSDLEQLLLYSHSNHQPIMLWSDQDQLLQASISRLLETNPNLQDTHLLISGIEPLFAQLLGYTVSQLPEQLLTASLLCIAAHDPEGNSGWSAKLVRLLICHFMDGCWIDLIDGQAELSEAFSDPSQDLSCELDLFGQQLNERIAGIEQIPLHILTI